MNKKLSEDKKEIRKNFKTESQKILKQIESYGDFSKFPVDDARRAIAYGWSICSRLENELIESENKEKNEELIEDYITNTPIKTKADATAQEKLLNYVKRLEAKVSRVNILIELQKANKSLISQMVDNQKIVESKERSKYIAITTHAAQLSAFQEIQRSERL